MSRCKACNNILSEREMCQKDSRGMYYDTCGHCRQQASMAIYGDNEEDALLRNAFFRSGRKNTTHRDYD